MRRHVRVVTTIGTSAVVLATGSTIVLATEAGHHSAVRALSGGSLRTASACVAPALPGAVVDVTLADMGRSMRDGRMMALGGMMGPGRTPGAGAWWPAGTMTVQLSHTSVVGETVSLRVTNTGVLLHELVVLPLTGDAPPGARAIGADGTVSEAGSLGEASRNCGAGAGNGISPGGVSWTTVSLKPGRYELVCNLPGHYAAGMHSELDVTS